METAVAQEKILVVEDDTFLLKAISKFISRRGYEALEAVNGRDAMELVRNEQPALILSDLRMPVMDGLDLLDEVAREAPEIPVIILSGVGAKPDIIQAFRAGAWDYVTKPIDDIDVLVDKIERTLVQARMTYGYSETMEKAVKRKSEAYEEERRKRRELEIRIAHAKQELERMIDALGDPFALLDHNHCLLRMNRAMAALEETGPAELVGKTRYLSTDGFDNREQAAADFLLISRGHHLTGTFFDQKRQRKYEVRMTPYYDADRRTVTGCVYIAREMTERA